MQIGSLVAVICLRWINFCGFCTNNTVDNSRNWRLNFAFTNFYTKVLLSYIRVQLKIYMSSSKHALEFNFHLKQKLTRKVTGSLNTEF